MRVCLSSGNYSVIDSRQVFLFREEDELKIDIAAENGLFSGKLDGMEAEAAMFERRLEELRKYV